jgi:NADH-quinone oxidoreductase subunit G
MATLEIDGQQVAVEDGTNLIQAAERLGIEIPHYCYHPGLPVAGNCRMCLVEIEKFPKLQIACNTRATEGMVVRTRSERVKRAQAAVLEFLLVNHPIDCPVCDQAGECKLQDYYMDYDRQPSRVPLEAKVKKGKAIDIGPLVMLDQERCILCTRCTRFLDEVTKTSELGIFERGNHCEINLFPGRRLENPYSGNVVDICPVGALTSKDFRFRARVWYLEATRSVCPTCATGCNIDIHHRRGEMFRLRPRFNPDVNGYWMCDEGRLSYKGFQGEGRLLHALIRKEERWERRPVTEATRLVVDRLRDICKQFGGRAVRGVVGAQATCEEAFLFQQLVGRVLGGRVGGFRWSPPDAYHDDFLIDADRNPNTMGLQALGIGSDGVDGLMGDVAAGQVGALALLRADPSLALGAKDLDLLADRVDFVVVIDTHYRMIAEAADVVLPAAAFAETDGTVVNRNRRAQLLRQAFAPPGDARPGWQLLREMLAYAGEDAPASASGVLEQIAAAIPAFGGLSYAAIGELGAPLQPE